MTRELINRNGDLELCLAIVSNVRGIIHDYAHGVR